MFVFDTALGLCGVRWSERGITEVVMPGSRQLSALGRRRRRDLPPAVRDVVTGIVALARRRAARPVRDRARRTLPRSLPFRRLRRHPRDRPGATATYGEIARTIGAPGAARAVGAALGSNPYPIIVPCHRVLAADGALHGFSAPGGIVTKRRMLEIERAPGFTQASLFASRSSGRISLPRCLCEGIYYLPTPMYPVLGGTAASPSCSRRPGCRASPSPSTILPATCSKSTWDHGLTLLHRPHTRDMNRSTLSERASILCLPYQCEDH